MTALRSALVVALVACTGEVEPTETTFASDQGVVAVEATNEPARGRWRGRLVLENPQPGEHLVFVGHVPVTRFADVAAFDEKTCPVFAALPRVGVRLQSIDAQVDVAADYPEGYEAPSTTFTLQDVGRVVYFTVVRRDLAPSSFRVRFEIEPGGDAGPAIMRALPAPTR